MSVVSKPTVTKFITKISANFEVLASLRLVRLFRAMVSLLPWLGKKQVLIAWDHFCSNVYLHFRSDNCRCARFAHYDTTGLCKHLWRKVGHQ